MGRSLDSELGAWPHAFYRFTDRYRHFSPSERSSSSGLSRTLTVIDSSSLRMRE